MIIIVNDSTPGSAPLVQKIFLENYVPCALIGTSELVDMLPAAIVVGERLSASVAIAMCEFNGCEYNVIRGFHSGISPAETADDICDLMREKGINLNMICDDRFTYEAGEVYFYDRSLYLTKRETIIARLIFYANRWLTVDDIARYCWPADKRPSKGAVSVHVHNINAKSEKYCGIKLIRYKRYRGYMLNKL